MTYINALVFVLILKAILSSNNITTTHKRMHLNKTKQNTLAILSHDKVIVGYQSGKIQIVDIQNNKLNNTFFYLQNSVQSITVLDSRTVFVNDQNKVMVLDHLGQVIKKLQGKQPNKGVIAAYNATGMGYMSIIRKNVVQQRIFQNITYGGYYLNFFDTGQHGGNYAAYSPLHTHLYIVNNRKNKILIYDLTQTTIFDIDAINQTMNYSLNQNKANSSSQNKKIVNNTQREAKSKEMQKRMIQIISNNRKYVILERNFNFKIKQILTDYKQATIYNQALLIVSQDDTVYYTNKAAISTFLPYKNHTDDQLISICFCQKVYLLILHRHLSQDHIALFYLSFFNKKTLISQKVLLINNVFPGFKQIKTMDCNFKRITLLTEQSQILIIDNQYEDQKIQSIQTQLGFQQIQLIVTIVLVALFICYCRRKPEKKQNSQQDEQQPQENMQVEQINEAQIKKQDQFENKTSENSSQQDRNLNQKQKEKSNKDKLFHNQNTKPRKNKKKLS